MQADMRIYRMSACAFMSDLFASFGDTLTDGLYQGMMKLAINVNQMERNNKQEA
ncbi:hypothetical protein [Paenibacillus sanguinis]|uniref:hypothetical protein n=1 Tax=Paenibacillus sanguinis TaxID=225906 RepID=UPI000375D873|nr:hypothetical protein [Paenibacillus sanguinis]